MPCQPESVGSKAAERAVTIEKGNKRNNEKPKTSTEPSTSIPGIDSL